MAYNLGIDIGIASVGFGAVDLQNSKIISCGARIFEAAENPKDGSSLAVPRREKRAMRRVIHRRAVRKNAIRQLLQRHQFINTDIIDQHITSSLEKSVWDLRREALIRQITDDELIRILFHIAKRRGFQSNRKGAAPNEIKEEQKALSGARELQDAMGRTGAETVGAYLSALAKKRNGDGSYENFVDRSLLRAEVIKIFARQRSLGNSKATTALEQEFVETAFFQRPLQSSEHLIGYCTLEPSEKRAPKFSYTAELFILWSKLNNTRIKDRSGNERSLSQDEKLRLADKAHKLKTFKFSHARKELSLSENERFNISYLQIDKADTGWEKIRDAAEGKEFAKLPGYHTLKDALDTGSTTDWQNWLHTKRDTLDEIARILSVLEDPQQIENALASLSLTGEQCHKLSGITSFSKVVDLSLTAMRKILPHLQQGLTYDKACSEAGYNHSAQQNQGLAILPKFEDVRNPVVNRALAQARKVINAVIRKHGKPDTIIIELARDVGKNFKDRKEIEREQKKNQEYREDAKKHVAEVLGIIPDNVSGEDILKQRLWKEQEGFCPYSGLYITPEMLRDPVATQIDHIIPYSRSWNDSYMNKVLCTTTANQEKGNDTPREYFVRTGKSIEALEVVAGKLPRKKAENLLIENFDEEKGKEWKDRALNDTRYMARLLKNHIERNLALGTGNRVQTRNGSLTAHLRGEWGFPDKDRRNDRHHALDGLVLATSTQSMVQKLSNWNKCEARRLKPAERPYPPKPWDTFREDAKKAIEGVFVSRMPVRKITGAAHEETIRRIRHLPDGQRQIIQTVKLSGLKPDMLEKMVDKERNIRLYTLLKERLDAHDGKPDKAFATPIYMPVNDPSKTAPRINSIRIITNEKSGVEINNGLASNGDMVRVDVFARPNRNGKLEYYLVPLYVHHFAAGGLPNKAADAKQTIMTDFEFVFSLYKNDYVMLRKSESDVLEGYFRGMDISNASITIRTHDSDPSFGKEGDKPKNGVKTLLAFEKYSVDIFGQKHRIVKEPRLGVACGDDPEPGEAESAEDAA